MPQPQQRPATAGEIVKAVKAYLIAKNLASKDQVLLVARDSREIPKFRPPKTIWLRPRGIRPDQPQFDGSGRFAFVVSRVLDVEVAVRLVTDTTDTDEQWLTADSGLFGLEEDVLNILQGWTPTDPQGNALLVKPMVLLSETDPLKGPGLPLWGDVVLSFLITYQTAIDRGTP